MVLADEILELLPSLGPKKLFILVAPDVFLRETRPHIVLERSGLEGTLEVFSVRTGSQLKCARSVNILVGLALGPAIPIDGDVGLHAVVVFAESALQQAGLPLDQDCESGGVLLGGFFPAILSQLYLEQRTELLNPRGPLTILLRSMGMAEASLTWLEDSRASIIILFLPYHRTVPNTLECITIMNILTSITIIRGGGRLKGSPLPGHQG